MSIKGIKHIFFDLDHTIWDFDTNSRLAFELMFHQNDLEQKLNTSFDTFHKAYIIHNLRYWDLYSRGHVNQSELRWKRMYETLNDFIHSDEALAKSLSVTYLELLPHHSTLFPGTKEILQYLSDKQYQLHILSNGFEQTQSKKLNYSGIHHFFNHIITSEVCGFVKPDKKIFEHAMQLCDTQSNSCIMIGDSPDADLQGAVNAGIQSIYVDHLSKETEIPHTYRVRMLREIENIL